MKTLIIVRHAKAEQNFGPDIKRKLNERGNKNAPEMAKRLIKKGYIIEKIISSPSARTKETAAYFAKANHIAEKNILYFDDLYLGDIGHIVDTILSLDNDASCIALFGHNPGVTNFVNDTTGSRLESLPTCGIAVITFNCDSWQEINTAQKVLALIDYPKKHSE